MPIEECAGDLMLLARLSLKGGAVAKASLNWAFELVALDPKLDDLLVSRMKPR